MPSSKLYPSDKDVSGAPYYDDYDSTKEYVKILALPGRVEQAREFSQIQEIVRDHLGRLGDTIHGNGKIISGCVLTVKDKKATLSAGRIYLDGLVRYTRPCELTIAGVGAEIIAAKVETSLITEHDDSSLRDPAQNYVNYGQPGAHRIKQSVVFSVETSASTSEGTTPIYALNNGEIVKSESSSDSNSLLYETLARRTYDENGSYKVDGLELRDRYESNATDQILISVTQGKAYVNGYEVTKPASTTVPIKFSKATRSVLNEPKIYSTGNKIYNLNNSPAKELKSVLAVVKVTEQVSRGSIAGGLDFLANHPVVRIIEVKSASKTYQSGVDYQLSNDGVDWSLTGGSEPPVGSSYEVTYTYNCEMLIGTDVELLNEHNPAGNAINSKIKLLNDSKLPVQGTTMLVDYDYYLARKDLIVLDQNGIYTVYEGVPDVERLCESPINQDNTKLVIGTVLVGSGYSDENADQVLKTVQLVTSDAIRLSQDNLYNLKKRVDNLEYDISLTDLDKSAIEGQSATNLKGILTDGFIGVTKADTTHSDFDCCIDLDHQELTLPVSQNILKLMANMSSSESTARKFGSLFMAPYTDKVVLSQTLATKSFLVNPYAVYAPMAIVQLSPDVDNWIDTDKVIVNNSKTSSATLRRWWYHRGERWAESERQKWLQLTGTTGEQLGTAAYDSSSSATNTSTVLDEALMYMRQTEVQVSGSNFLPNSNNLACYFNDTKIPLTPTGTTTAGSEAGTVRSDAEGKFTAKFTVLKNTPCGTVSVVISNSNNRGSAMYTAQGRRQVIQETVLTSRTVVNPYDPLAQAFMVDKQVILTKVGLYFSTKDPAKSVVVQIRNMVNGYPGVLVYDEVVVESANVKVSDNASEETIVNFNQPVICNPGEQYCICILSDSNQYEMWVANLGEKDVQSGNFVTTQPYTAGVMFSSSNSMTWTAHQASDLKFNIYRAEYTGQEGTLVFNDVTTTNMNRLLLAAQSIDLQNLGISWWYRLKSGDPWLPISTYVDQELASLATTVQVKVILPSNSTSSPILSGDTINLISFNEKSTGTYLSRTVAFDSTYNKVAVSVEAYKPSGTEFKIYISSDGNSWTELDSPTTTPVDETYVRYSYTKSVSPVKTYKVKIVMSTGNPLARPKLRKLINIMRME